LFRTKNAIVYHTKPSRVPDLDAFERSYIRQALWSSDDDNHNPLDLNHDIMELPVETIQRLKDDCYLFRSSLAVRALLREAYELRRYGDEQAGGDYWLSRNSDTTAGFWDQKLGIVGESLTTLARSMGPRSLVIGINGDVEVE
jgi:hypothetical protein